MHRILYDVPRWDVYLHRKERKLPIVKDDDSDDLQFEDEVFERLYSGEMIELRFHPSPTSAAWAKKGHELCDGLGLDVVTPYCRDAPFNAALATAWLMELIEDPLEEAKEKAEESSGGGGGGADEEDETAAEGLEFVDLGGVGNNQSQAENVAEQLHDRPNLKLIALFAGRLRSTVITKQRARSTGSQEITNTTIGGELDRLLPSELVRLTSRKRFLKLAAMRDLVERKMMQYEMIATEAVQEGPIVVLIDKSTSMEGARDVWASAVALAMLDIAQSQKRAFALVSFNHGIIKLSRVNAGGKLSVDDLLIAPGGDTNIAKALAVSLELIQRCSNIKNGDVILITDGEDTGSHQVIPIKKKAEDMGVTFYGVGIESDGVRPWCHKSHVITDLTSVDEATMDLLFTI